MLHVTRKASTLTVETLGGRLTWDAQGGGQICAFTIKDELAEHPLLPTGNLLPDLHFTRAGRRRSRSWRAGARTALSWP